MYVQYNSVFLKELLMFEKRPQKSIITYIRLLCKIFFKPHGKTHGRFLHVIYLFLS